MSEDLAAFRAETRAWLEAHCPPEMREPVRSDKDVCWGGRKARFSSAAQKQWLDIMGARGWTVPDWPKEYGGGGLSAAVPGGRGRPVAQFSASVPIVALLPILTSSIMQTFGPI